MRKMIGISLVALVLIGGLAFSSVQFGFVEAAEGKMYEIKFGTMWPVEHPVTKAVEKIFIPQVEKKTDGKVKITQYPNFMLGSERELSEGVMAGQIEMSGIGNLVMTMVPELKVPELPFMWEKEDDFWKAVDGEFGDIYKKALRKRANLVSLTLHKRGFRHITSSKPINGIEDMKGFKLRLPEVDYYVAMAKGLGAIPTVITLPEVYSALQQGVADGQENPLETIFSMKFYEVQPYLAMTGHILTFGNFLINADYFDAMPAEYQKAMLEAAEETRDEIFKDITTNESFMLEEIEKSGVKVTYPDKVPFQQALRFIIDDFKEKNDWSAEVFKACGK